jgi:enamine deaminase RidA (YjgF/YER057c/UK114 family)
MIKRLKVGPRMSQIVVHGDTVYLAGVVADDPSADVAGQTRQILSKIDAYLKEAGTDKNNILMATIWLSDIGTFDQMNGVWDAWVPQGHTPARACVESKLARPEFKVEIRVIAGL